MDQTIIKQPLRLGVAAFFVAALGAAMGFAAHALELRWLALSAFWLVVVAVACGFFAVAWGWRRIASGQKSGNNNAI